MPYFLVLKVPKPQPGSNCSLFLKPFAKLMVSNFNGSMSSRGWLLDVLGSQVPHAVSMKLNSPVKLTN